MRVGKDNQISHDFQTDQFQSNAWVVSYYTKNVVKESITGHLNLYTERLETLLTHISELTGKHKFILVAHSMGGLIARNVMVQSQ